MPSPSQDDRPVKVYTALPEGTLLFGSMNAVERLSELFEYELVLVSDNGEIDPAELLGTDLTVELELPAGGFRHFHGYVADCADAPGEGCLAGYELSVRPWLWFLTRTADCRIFQEMRVPDIVRMILDEEGFTDVEDELTATYATRTYCVQYRESDFHFISRLLEQEGIHYYFRHEHGVHRLVLGDGGSGHATLPDYAEVPLFPPDALKERERDHISDWNLRKCLQPGRFAVRDFNFEMPGADLELGSSSTISHARSDFEIFDYPGGYPERDTGEVRARLLLEESDTRHERATGGGNVRGLLAGNRFRLTGAERERDNREYLVTGSECSFELANFRSGGEGGLTFRCHLAATGSGRPYRAPRRTPRPHVQGPQTAMVVGPAGEEIWTDKHGRVKLQFHWDRYGTSDENSSCWVRVSQLWAGQGWGAMHVPRIGHEVIVEFLEGDPDRPIVTGRVYNGSNPVPHSLPAGATQSGIRSRSSKGGSSANFNEIRMEDKKGEEELYIHAEKNQGNVVENDESSAVGHDRVERVGNDETIEVGNDRTERVVGNESIAIGANRIEQVAADETITIGGSRTVTIARNKTESVALDKAESVGAAKQLSIGGTYALTVGRDGSAGFGGTSSVEVGGAAKLTVGASRNIEIADDQKTMVGKILTLEAGEEIVIRTGRSSITMKKDGTIDIAGKDVSIGASGAVTIKAARNVVLKGAKVLNN